MQKNEQVLNEQSTGGIMDETAIAVEFITCIELFGFADVTDKDIGTILRTFPVVGGDCGCIFINANDETVRLVQRENGYSGWYACEDVRWRPKREALRREVTR